MSMTAYNLNFFNKSISNSYIILRKQCNIYVTQKDLKYLKFSIKFFTTGKASVEIVSPIVKNVEKVSSSMLNSPLRKAVWIRSKAFEIPIDTSKFSKSQLEQLHEVQMLHKQHPGWTQLVPYGDNKIKVNFTNETSSKNHISTPFLPKENIVGTEFKVVTAVKTKIYNVDDFKEKCLIEELNTFVRENPFVPDHGQMINPTKLYEQDINKLEENPFLVSCLKNQCISIRIYNKNGLKCLSSQEYEEIKDLLSIHTIFLDRNVKLSEKDKLIEYKRLKEFHKEQIFLTEKIQKDKYHRKALQENKRIVYLMESVEEEYEKKLPVFDFFMTNFQTNKEHIKQIPSLNDNKKKADGSDLD